MADYIGETNKFGNTVALPFTSFATATPDLLDLAYSADDLTRQNDMFWLDGVRRDSGDWDDGDGAVRWINGFNIAVRPFRAHVNGTIVYADQIILTVEPEASSTRIDSVVIRRDYLARKADVILLKGESGSGVPTELRYNHFGVADYELARVTISNSMVSLAQTDITDMRRPLLADFGVRPTSDDKGKTIRVDSVGGLQLEPSGIFPGKIDLLPVRPGELRTYAPGWYFCNGDRYQLSSEVGEALSALHSNLKADFGITVSGTTINVPNMFYIDGRGYFLRAVNSSARFPGWVEGDAMRNVWGNIYHMGGGHNILPGADGAFSTTGWAASQNVAPGVVGNTTHVTLDASRIAPVAAENRPLNIGMTPAIFLGV